MQIKILHWNIWFQERAENIIKLVKKVKPDIMCLQELTADFHYNDGQDVAKIIAEKLGLEYNFAVAHKFKDNHIQGNGIFSRFPIVENANFFVTESGAVDDYSSEGRSCAVSKLRLDKNREIYIATTHLSYNHKLIENEKKMEETKRLLSSLKDYGKRLVLTGDLNVTPDSQSIKFIEKHLVHCGPNYKKPTWTTKPFSHNGFEETELIWRLDYVFATRDIKCFSSEIIETGYSDHLPILATITA